MSPAPAERPGWDGLGREWPNREASRFVEHAGTRWHLQLQGTGPDLLLLHGTGSATHSWAGLLPRLARHFRVIAPDLPGHGFTPAPRRDLLTLPGMAGAVSQLLERLGSAPRIAVGHSAGAAVLLRMVADRGLTPAHLIGLNPALVPPPAAYRLLLAPFVHRLAISGIVAGGAAALASRTALVDSLLRSTGLALTPEQRAWYGHFFRSEQHVHDVLTMMSDWALTDLERVLPRIDVRVTLIAGRADHWIPLRLLRRLATRLPRATVLERPGGHLLHEEHPEAIAALIAELAEVTLSR